MFSRILSGSRWTVCRNSAKYSDPKSSDRIKKREDCEFTVTMLLLILLMAGVEPNPGPTFRTGELNHAAYG